MEERLSDKQIREKAVNLGVESLTDAELIALLFREGDDTHSALAMAEEFLAAINLKSPLRDMSHKQLRSVAGIGISRAVYLKAALEAGHRFNNRQSEIEIITNSNEVVELFRPQIGRLDHEEFWALYLNSAGRLLDRIRISQGGISRTTVDFRLIVKRAVEKLATAIIIVHNHPDGDPTPSQEDKSLTERLVQGCALLDITVADHIIITADTSFSFRSQGLL